ncbi:suppressor of Triplolethal [Lycorma delicatula]|uniref:suppressor of Triplolethal n=1 Tax=Lycorma delicatula TaxID=130591 RepID=UPI003F50D7FE
MAALVAGVQYSLSSQGNFNENKSLIFVKLTDSAYRAIEEYIRNKNKCTQTPTIQFLGNEGHLSLPSSQSARGEAGFNFSLTSNEDIEGPQGSFECIQQTSSRCLENVGLLHCKMRVQANEDVYDVTRQRMAAAEQMHKKNCTREIELDKAGIGRRVKRSIKPISGGGGGSRTTSINGFHRNSSPSPVLSSFMNHNHTAPAHHVSAPQKSNVSDIMKRPIRDRLIHMLAVRPYKKPELFNVLNKEGLRDKDKNQLMSTLCKVAVQRDNTYHLLRHVWNDVREDWPYYTEQDRQMLKRRKPQNLTPPGSSDGGSSVGSGQSPSSVHPGSPPSAIEPPPSSKRPGYYDGADGLPTKRQRISHCKPAMRSDPTSVHKPNLHSKGGGDCGGGGGVGFNSSSNIVGSSTNGPNKYSGSGVRWSPSPTPGTVSTNTITSSNPTSSIPSHVDNHLNSLSSSPIIESKERKQHSSSISSTLSLSVSSSSPSLPSSSTLPRPTSNLSSNAYENHTEPKYIIDYPRIETIEQRRRYKEDFNTNYVEYRRLHSVVDKVSRRFAELEARLKRENKHSEAWKAIKNQIVEEYEEHKKDSHHHEAKRRFQYLHEKLSHIKRQVVDFDQRHNAASS